MTTQHKLLPCPFCGAGAMTQGTSAGSRVICNGCLAKSGTFIMPHFAEAAWNRRSPAHDDLVKALAWVVEAYEKTQFMRTADQHNNNCQCLRCAVDNAKHLAENAPSNLRTDDLVKALESKDQQK